MFPDISSILGNIFSSVGPALSSAWNTINPTNWMASVPSAAMQAASAPPASQQQQLATLASSMGANAPGAVSMAGPSGAAATPQTAQSLINTYSGAGNPNLVQQALNYAIKNPKEFADIWQTYQRYQMQQTLMDPNALAKAANQLNMGVSKPLRARLGQEVDASMQERGLGGAPGLYREAIAKAIAPYQYEASQRALQEELAALQAAGSIYPAGGPLGDFSNFLDMLLKQQAAQGSTGATP